MDEHDMKKKVEIENAKARLRDTKYMIAETLNRISKAETEFQDGKSHYSKKLKSLQSIQGTQHIKIAKLDSDIKTIEGILQSRMDEEIGYQKTNKQLKEEFDNLQNETTSTAAEFCSKLEALEENIKMGYIQLQNCKEAEVLLEVGLPSLKSEEQLPFIEKVLNKTLEAKRRREAELKEELNALDEAQYGAKRDIQLKTEELEQMKSEYADLIKVYNTTKKLKEVNKD